MMDFPLVMPVGSFAYPEGPIADALEAQIAATLPEIAGLEDAPSGAARAKVYASVIDQQRHDFVEQYGEAFGWERRSKDRGVVPAVLGVGVLDGLPLKA